MPTPALQHPEFTGVKFILMDIEGTTTDIQFVKNVLFPYSAKELRNFISTHKNNPTVRECLTQADPQQDENAILQLLKWIAEDVKHPALKTLQGMIWKNGYESKAYQSPLYPDVLPAWQKWQTAGLRLGIYSSGSVPAQKLLFGFTEQGDVTKYLSAYFDLDVGSKRETASYQKIATQLELSPPEILFLSDIEAELSAAQSAGFQVAHVVRPGTTPSEKFQTVANFLEI